MKRGLFVTGLMAAALATAALAGGFAVTRMFDADGVVTVTNTQANSVWSPVAVLVAYETPATGTVSVARVSGGVEYALGAHEASSATGLVWVAEAAYPFEFGDTLLLRSPETNATVQVILKAN